MTQAIFSNIVSLAFLLSYPLHTLALHPPASLSPPPDPLTINTTSTNKTTSPNTSANSNALQISCNAALGNGLVASSCFNALSYSPTSDVLESWGVPGRRMPGTGLDVELPVRVFSDDATCAIVPKTEHYHQLAHASAHEVTEAARAVMRDCVIARRIGGTARMIGGDNRLVVNVAGFDPHVTCYTAMSAPVASCGYIMQEMLKTEYRETFGHAPNPGIRVALPLTLKSADGKCQVYIETRSPTIWARWYDVWEAVEATVAVCVRRGRWGWSSVTNTALPVPKVQDLFVVVTDEPWPPPQLLSLGVGNLTNGSNA